ncbi:MAG: hypothetical protein MJ195_02880 [Mycoplasmoidaceae bacterium]|nr:hypothetical protein [Mycoplasmoidaceae bacterium]
MKKTKLLMPILGVAAVAGTVVPAVVSCGPKAEEKIKLSINNIGILNPTDKVQVVSVKLPEVVADQDYKAEAS